MKALLLFILLFPLVAGCLQGEPSIETRYATATYAKEGTVETKDRKSFILEETRQALSTTGEQLPAHILVMAEGEADPRDHYLDGAFRVIRKDYPCIGRDCMYLDWERGRMPLPLGIGFLAQYRVAGALEFIDTSGVPYTLVPNLSESGSSVRLGIDPVQVPSSHGYLAGTYEYADSAIFPVKVKLGSSSWIRTSYRAGPDLPSIDTRLGAVVPIVGLASEMFPGETEPLPDFGIIPLEALETLRNKSSEANQMLTEGGCIVRASFIQAHASGSGLLPNQVRPEVIVSIQIASDPSSAKTWTMTWGTDFLGGKAFTDPEGPSQGRPPPIPGGCDEVRKSPPIAMPVQQFMEKAKNLPISSPAGPDFIFQVTNGSIHQRAAEQGWARYALTYYPPGSDPTASGTFFPNSIAFNANSQTWVYMQVPTRDVVPIDGA